MFELRAMRHKIAVSDVAVRRESTTRNMKRPECFGRAAVIGVLCRSKRRLPPPEARPPKALRAFSFGTDRTGRVSSVPLAVAATEKIGVRVPGVSDWGPWTGSASQSRKRRKGVTAKAGGRVGLHELRQPRLRDANRQHSEKHQQGRGHTNPSHRPTYRGTNHEHDRH